MSSSPQTICSISWCCRVDPLPILCDLCGSRFCSEHGASYAAHECRACTNAVDGTFRDPRDKRVAVCPCCDKPVTWMTVVGAAATTATAAEMPLALREVEQELARETTRVSALINARLNEGTRMRGLVDTAWAMSGANSSEDEVRNSLQLAKLNELKQRKEDILLAIHLEKCPAVMMTDVSTATAAHQQPAATTTTTTATSTSTAAAQPPRQTCSHKGCREAGGSGGFKIKCKGCSKMFCLSHRFPEVHACASISTKPTQPASTQKLGGQQQQQQQGKAVTAAVAASVRAANTPAARAAMARAQQQQQLQERQQQMQQSQRSTSGGALAPPPPQTLSEQEAELVAMGFSVSDVREALSKTGNSLAAAVEILCT